MRTGPTPAFFARGASSASAVVAAVGDIESALLATEGGVGGSLGGVLSVFILGSGNVEAQWGRAWCLLAEHALDS